jgi:hypothetical protein
MKQAHHWYIDADGNGRCLECGKTKKFYATLGEMIDDKQIHWTSRSHPTEIQRIEAGDIFCWNELMRV